MNSGFRLIIEEFNRGREKYYMYDHYQATHVHVSSLRAGWNISTTLVTKKKSVQDSRCLPVLF